MYLKLLIFITILGSLMSPRQALSCIVETLGAADGVPGKRFQIRIQDSDTRTQNSAWLNHARFLTALDILPTSILLTAAEDTLAPGELKKPEEFVSALQALARNPAGNILLRFLGSRATSIAREVGRPELAGDLLVAMLNVPALHYEDMGGYLVPRPNSAAHYFQKMGFDIFPSIAELLPLLERDEATASATILTSLWRTMREMVGMLNGQSTPYALMNARMNQALAETGGTPEPHAFQFPIITWEKKLVSFNIHFGPQNPHPAVMEISQHSIGPQFLFPSSGDTLRLLGLPWSTSLTLDATEIGAMLSVSPDLAGRMQGDIWLFQRVMYPLLASSGAFHGAQAEFSGIQIRETGDHRATAPVFKVDASTADEWREQAIRQAILATFHLYGPPERVTAFQHLIYALMARDPQMTFVRFEGIARKFNLAVYLVADSRTYVRETKVYPPLPAFQDRTNTPSHHLTIAWGEASIARELLTSIRLTDDENLRLLDTDTGMRAPAVDPR